MLEDRDNQNELLTLYGEVTREDHVDTQFLYDYIFDQTIKPLKRAQIAIHLAVCPECANKLALLKELSDTDSQRSSVPSQEASIHNLSHEVFVALPLARLLTSRSRLTLQIGNIVLPPDIGAALPSLLEILWSKEPTRLMATPETYQSSLAAAFGASSSQFISDSSRQIAQLARFLQIAETTIVKSCLSLTDVKDRMFAIVSEAKKRSGATWPDSLDRSIADEYIAILGEERTATH
jgi:hypothetical protein